jgi:S-formylglutathione hydrolase FrmB
MMNASRCGTASLLAGSLWLTSCIGDPGNEVSDTEALSLDSSDGITVTGSRWISPRTLEVDISTPLVAPVAVNGPHRIRITFPVGYDDDPDTRYPTLYLLHGGAGGNSAQWTTGGGAAEFISDGRPVILVMPDGGKVGWFTDWVDQSRGAQRWASFYLDQLVPWVDHNLRTVAARDGRAIAGLSMGGYGAVRLAQDRPELFASVASFSGAVDLGDMGTRAVVTEQAWQHGFHPYAPFGSPFYPDDTAWKANDPMKRAGRLAGMQVLLYAGAGIHDADILERTMGQSTDRFSRTLDAAGVPRFWWMYGRPGPAAPFACDGGHNFGCWNFALDDALPRMLSVLAAPPAPPGSNLVVNPGFEGGPSAWRHHGVGGADVGVGLARTGAGNGWTRGSAGWNDLHQIVLVAPGRTYRLTGWMRTSANNRDGFFGLRTGAGQVIGEQRFATLGPYTQITVTASSGPHHSLEVFAGVWADGDTWLQLDDVAVVEQ